MFWVSVTVLGVLHYCFHKGRRLSLPPVEQEVSGGSCETPPPVEQEVAGESWDTDAGISRAAEKTLETETDPWERHILYTQAIETAYKNRKTSSDDHDMTIDLSERYINEFQKLMPTVFDRLGDRPRVIAAFKLLAIILEEDGDYDRAVALCKAALTSGVEDGTKSGFEGRIQRILNRQGQPQHPEEIH